MPGKRRGFQRAERVNQELLQAISRILMTEVRDERVREAQVTAVQCAPDLSFARVFYVSMGAREADEALQQALERLAGFMRGQLAQHTQMRHVPSLRFVYDTSIEHGRRMEHVLSGMRASDAKVAQDDEERAGAQGAAGASDEEA